MLSPIKVWRRQKIIRKIFGKTGIILTWTKIAVPTLKHKAYSPYFVALIEMEDGQKLYGQIVDIKNGLIATGQKVMPVLRRAFEPQAESIIPYGVKFKILD